MIKKKLDYRHYIAIIITLGFISLSVFYYKNSFIRIKETCRDVFQSLKYYFATLFSEETDLTCSVVERSVVSVKDIIPVDFETFKYKLGVVKGLFFNGENFRDYLSYISNGGLIFTTVLNIIIMLNIVIKMLLDIALKKVNNDCGKDTKAVTVCKKTENRIKPVFAWIKDFVGFCLNRKYRGLWLIIWLYNLNIYAVIGEVFAYIYYLIASFDLGSIYVQIYKLLIDISLMISSLPWYIWIVVVFCFISVIRKKKAIKKLRHNELKNTGFAKSLGIATMFTSPMNGGKTKMVTDLSLTFVTVFKDNALETMQKIDLEFKEFPFVRLEKHIRELRARHVIYSLASVESYFTWKRKYFEYCLMKYKRLWCATPRSILYDYDYEKYGLYYDNKLYNVYIFDAIITYAKAYFIYSMPDSFIVSNYAIREDGILEDLGNLPLWDYNYFNRESDGVNSGSYYSKILDFDVLRKGKKVQPNNPLADTFEFGIVSITEFDKDRGNTLDTKELKKTVEETNQKNDLFNYSPKMARHSATIDFNPYVRYLFDLQRAMKTEADLREICDCIIEVGDIDKGKLAMPLFFIEEIIYGFVFSRFRNFYTVYRFYHGNNTLYMYILKKICGKFLNYYSGIYNLYGYDVQRLRINNGKLNGKEVKHKYYEAYGKIHALRYSTDCYSGYFKEGVLKKGKGIIDYPAYGSYLATREELNKQNSYFIRDLEKVNK